MVTALTKDLTNDNEAENKLLLQGIKPRSGLWPITLLFCFFSMILRYGTIIYLLLHEVILFYSFVYCQWSLYIVFKYMFFVESSMSLATLVFLKNCFLHLWHQISGRDQQLL